MLILFSVTEIGVWSISILFLLKNSAEQDRYELLSTWSASENVQTLKVVKSSVVDQYCIGPDRSGNK